MAIEFGERIRRIPSYPLAAGYDLGEEVAMLASNESCFGPSEAVIDAAERAMRGANRYPDPSYRPLREALSARYGVAPE
ncbi:MAG: histidinol-phosphate transaminase, partial [Solirubrobacteraceae bacterium]